MSSQSNTIREILKDSNTPWINSFIERLDHLEELLLEEDDEDQESLRIESVQLCADLFKLLEGTNIKQPQTGLSYSGNIVLQWTVIDGSGTRNTASVITFRHGVSTTYRIKLKGSESLEEQEYEDLIGSIEEIADFLKSPPCLEIIENAPYSKKIGS